MKFSTLGKIRIEGGGSSFWIVSSEADGFLSTGSTSSTVVLNVREHHHLSGVGHHGVVGRSSGVVEGRAGEGRLGNLWCKLRSIRILGVQKRDCGC
nr:hypothetical protein Iba_chr01aCG16840 [Ipomoea batatas]